MMCPMPPVVALDEADDTARFGGKAAGLAACLRGGLRVPPGVAAPAGEVDPAAVATAVEAAGLAAARLAVRSSAVGEDSGRDSFAGMLLSVMDVELAELPDAIAAVLDSVHSPEAVAYCRMRGLSGPGKCGVIVQELVPADISGVMFTRDPVGGKDELVVEAARGLGDAVVSGRVTPAGYRLTRNGSVAERRPAPDGPGPESEPGLVAALVALAGEVDAVFPGGSDVEWAMADGELWVLQRRPITTS